MVDITASVIIGQGFLMIAIDLGIYHWVKKEYIESKELNDKLNKVYKTKKRRVNANQLVKAVIAQEANNEAENASLRH